MAKASFWETVNNLNKLNCFIPVYPCVQDKPNASSPYFGQLIPLRMDKNGWKKRISDRIRFCLHLRLERDVKHREKQIAFIHKLERDQSVPTPECSSGFDLSADSSINIQTNNNCTATSGCGSECNLDAHANEQHLTIADDVGAATTSRLEPDGSCHTEHGAGVGSSAVSPALAAAVTGFSATSEAENIGLVLLAATVGFIVLAFFYQKQT